MTARGNRKWVFTLNNPTDEDDRILIKLRDNKAVTMLVFQPEVAPSTGTRHYQGTIHFKDAKTLTAVKKILGNKCHLEIQKGSDQQTVEYCSKEATKTEGLTVSKLPSTTDKNSHDIILDIKSGMKYKDLVETHFAYFTKYNKSFHELFELYKPSKQPIINIELFPWEEDMLKIFREAPIHRTIHWIWSEESNTGKTIFKQYCQQLFNVLDVNNFKYVDIMHSYDDNDIIWTNLSRVDSLDDTKLHVLEKLSDGGMQQSTKYEGSKKYLNSHIVVTSNHPPPFNQLPERIHAINVSRNKKQNIKPILEKKEWVNTPIPAIKNKIDFWQDELEKEEIIYNRNNKSVAGI